MDSLIFGVNYELVGVSGAFLSAGEPWDMMCRGLQVEQFMDHGMASTFRVVMKSAAEKREVQIPLQVGVGSASRDVTLCGYPICGAGGHLVGVVVVARPTPVNVTAVIIGSTSTNA